eukprot:jgi/Ulvmu1/5884/UM026_0004.1
MTGQQTATGNESSSPDSLIDASFFRVPFEALKREARCRKTMVERLHYLCGRINTASAGKISHSGESDEAVLVTVLEALEQLKQQERPDHDLRPQNMAFITISLFNSEPVLYDLRLSAG